MEKVTAHDLESPVSEKTRLLLLLDQQKELDLITRWLGPDYEIAVPKASDLPSLAFDLAILDAPNLYRYGDLIRARKQSEQPFFLPILLLTPPENADLLGRHFRRTLDEIILTPIRKSELNARVANLLKMRRLSSVQQSRETSADRSTDYAPKLIKADETLQQKARDLQQARASLSRLKRTLLAIRQCNQALVRAGEEQSLLQEICRIIAETGGYPLAWVGFPENDEVKTVRPVAHSGPAAEYLENTKVSWANNELGKGPTGTAIRTGKIKICHNPLTDPNYTPWRTNSVKHGFRSCIALPLLVSGQTLGALNIYASETDCFDAEEVRFLAELANDLAFGVMVRRTQAEHRRLTEESALKASLLDLATDSIYVTDFEGNFIYVNEATCRSRGYTREELLGLNLQELITSESARDRPQRLQKLLAKGEISFESAGFCKNGTVIPLEVHARMIDLQGRKVILSVTRDITERKRVAEINARIEAQLRQVQKMEALGTFAGGIAHEFNNVLGAIKGYLELALMTLEAVPNSDKVKSKLEAALRGGERARDLVKQILAFSRHTDQEALPLEVLPIVKEALKMLRASIPTTIEICQNLQPQCGLVRANPAQISQILMDLCSNAYHAMKDDGGTLEISLEPVQVENDLDLNAGAYLRLTVSDTGHGMDEQTLGRIFDPFFTTKPVGEGTGMGLSAIHGIVQNLGGAIRVSSELGRGSTFQVYLPSHLKAASAVTPSTEPVPRGTEHILLVDDEAPIVQIGQEYLQRLGYQVTGLTSSSQAWEDFRAHPEKFDLIITDLTMPAMTGIDLAKAAVCRRPDIPIILTTGYSETNIIDQAKDMGIRQCLMKPLVLRRLGWVVRQELDRKD